MTRAYGQMGYVAVCGKRRCLTNQVIFQLHLTRLDHVIETPRFFQLRCTPASVLETLFPRECCPRSAEALPSSMDLGPLTLTPSTCRLSMSCFLPFPLLFQPFNFHSQHITSPLPFHTHSFESAIALPSGKSGSAPTHPPSTFLSPILLTVSFILSASLFVGGLQL